MSAAKKSRPKARKPYSLNDVKLSYEDVPQGDPTKKHNRGKTRKYLTNKKPSGIMKDVNKIKRKDDKMVNNKHKKSNKRNAILSVAWLVEAAFRAYTGWILLANFDNVVAVAAAIYALGTAGIIVATHFFRAYK